LPGYYNPNNYNEFKKRTNWKGNKNLMTPRERIFATLQHQKTDRIPRCEIWIDGVWPQLGFENQAEAYVELGQDCIMLPGQISETSNAWKTGVDEWGRVWKDGMYVSGVLKTEDDLYQYSPKLDYVNQLFNTDSINGIKQKYPDHCLIYGTHIGPFTAAYMAMGFEQFFMRLIDDPGFVRKMLEVRTEWCIAQYQKAISLGAEVLVLGDDVAHKDQPMISPRMWQELMLPYHRRIVDALKVPVIWHSDGNIVPLLPMAVEAGFVGIHGLEPAAGIDLKKVKESFGRDLVLIGNLDINVLFTSDAEAVRREVDRCLEQGSPCGGYMLATCNSIFDGMNPESVAEMFRYQEERVYRIP